MVKCECSSAACKGCCVWLWSSLFTAVMEYDTAKIVHIKNWKVGLMNRVVQLGIFVYIIVWGIIIQKGYQDVGAVKGSVTTKVKGASFYNGSRQFMHNCPKSDHPWIVYDVADYIIPPQEPDSFFVMTNTWVTCDQSYGNCTEDPGIANCTDDPQICEPAGKVFKGGNGPTTGNCINDTCEILAWCPTERENDTFTHESPKVRAENFTVLIKNSIQFPTLVKGARKRNILGTSDAEFLKGCTFDPSTKDGLYCPIFSLKQIVDMVRPRENFTELSIKGGVIGLQITWNCDNLEWGLDHCNPEYSAERLDDRKVKISPGYNFRYAKYYTDDTGQQYRTLIKAYGILFKVQIRGQGGKFSFFTLVLKIGSMIALLAIATIISDVIVLYVLKSRNYYREKKYLNVTNPTTGDYDVIDSPEDDKETQPINIRPTMYESQ